ncbi:MAG: hypothetical protein ABUS48_04100 [Pseudomonadota bacterium]
MRLGVVIAGILAIALAQMAQADDAVQLEVHHGPLAQGDVIVAFPVGFQSVARLDNDVYRSGALGGQVLVLPRGTPIFVSSYSYRVLGDGRTLQGYQIEMWCGVRGPHGDAHGFCLLHRSRGWESAEIRSGSPYVPTNLAPSLPVNAPDIKADPEAARELPVGRESYRFGGWVADGVRVIGSASFEGHTVNLPEHRLRAGRDGVVKFQLGDVSLRLERAPSGRLLVTPLGPEQPL